MLRYQRRQKMIVRNKEHVIFYFLFISFTDIGFRLTTGERLPLEFLTLELGSTSTLECRVGETKSEFTLIWKSDNKILFLYGSNQRAVKKGKFKFDIKQNMSISWLHITNATLEDAGTYDCFVEFHTAGKSRHYSWIIAIRDSSKIDVTDPWRNDVRRMAPVYYNTTQETEGQTSPTSASKDNDYNTVILCLGIAVILTLITTSIRKKHFLCCCSRQQNFNVRDNHDNEVYTDMSLGVPEGIHYSLDPEKLHDSVRELYSCNYNLASGTETYGFSKGIDNKTVQNDYGPQLQPADLQVTTGNSNLVYENLHRSTKVFQVVQKPEGQHKVERIKEEDGGEDTYIQVTRLR